MGGMLRSRLLNDLQQTLSAKRVLQSEEMKINTKQFKHLVGIFNFDQRAFPRYPALEANQEGAQNGHSVPMDASPTGPTLPTTTIGTPKLLGPKQVPPNAAAVNQASHECISIRCHDSTS